MYRFLFHDFIDYPGGAELHGGDMVLDDDIIRGIGNGTNDDEEDPEHNGQIRWFFVSGSNFHARQLPERMGG
jgi:hypothetical protein